MLPGFRAVIATVVAAIGLLTMSFVLVATVRSAEGNRTVSLRADLLQRGRAPSAFNTEPRALLIIDTPERARMTPASLQGLESPPDIGVAPEIRTAEIDEIRDILLAPVIVAAAAAETPSAEPPVGGPLTAIQPAASERSASDGRAAKRAAAKKARAKRIAAERRAAARRDAQARRAKETTVSSFGLNTGAANPLDSSNAGFDNNR